MSDEFQEQPQMDGPYDGQQYAPQQYPQGPTTNVLSILSLVLSIISILTWAICFLVAPAFSLPAIICGHIGLAQIKKANPPQEGKGMAIAGLIVGYLNMAVMIIGLVIFLLFVGVAGFAAYLEGQNVNF